MLTALLPLLALFLIRLTPGIAFQSVAVAAPVMTADFGLSHAQIGLLLGAFMLPGMVVTIPAGLLARRIGDRPVILGALALIALGAGIASGARSLPMLFAARVLSGLGGATVLMLLLKMVTDRFSGRWLATALATILAALPAGFALGLLVLGPIPGALGWRATLGLAGVPALACMVLVPLVGRATPGASGPGASGEATVSVPLIAGAVASWACVNGTLAIITGFLPGYFVSLGRSVAGGAAAASLMAWSFAAALPFAGMLADRWLGRRASVVLGCLATAALLSVIAGGDGTAPVLIGLGLVYALVPGPLTAQLGQATPPAARAVVFGWYTAGSYAAMTIGPWAAGWLRDVTGDPRSPLLLATGLIVATLAPYAVMNGAAQPGRRAAVQRVGISPNGS